jgi:hypothetical protein
VAAVPVSSLPALRVDAVTCAGRSAKPSARRTGECMRLDLLGVTELGLSDVGAPPSMLRWRQAGGWAMPSDLVDLLRSVWSGGGGGMFLELTTLSPYQASPYQARPSGSAVLGAIGT